MTEYDTRVTAITVAPQGQPIYSEQATQVNIVDETGGEFVEVCQSGRTDLGKIAIMPEEWPALRDAVNKLINGCRGEQQ
jgi:hypothetical protein